MLSLNETGLQPLYKLAVRAFPKTKKRQHVVKHLHVDKLSFSTRKPSGSLLVTGYVSGGVEEHIVRISLSNVQFTDSAKPGYIHIQEGLSHHWVRPVDVNKNDVRIRCNCKDFRWRFSYYDYVDDSLRGSPPPKYHATERPGSANPKKLPGMCKHIMAVASTLDVRGLLRGRINPAKTKILPESSLYDLATEYQTVVGAVRDKLSATSEAFIRDPERYDILVESILKGSAEQFAEWVLSRISQVELTDINKNRYKARAVRVWDDLKEYAKINHLCRK